MPTLAVSWAKFETQVGLDSDQAYSNLRAVPIQCKNRFVATTLFPFESHA